MDLKVHLRWSILVGAIYVLSGSGLPAAELAAADASSAPVTFNRDIAPLVFAHCSGCHRAGEVAPFPLLTFEQVAKRAKFIQKVVGERIMPPWKGREAHGTFIGDRRLTDDQIALIARWVAQGAPEGNASDLAPLPRFRDGWKLGEPDLVVTMPEPYEVPAEGDDIYRNFVFSLSIPEGKFIKAIEFRPGNRSVVHHAAFTSDPSGRARKDDEADPAPGYKGSLNLPGMLLPGSLAAWAPGRDPLPLPDGLSLPWKNGTDFIMQLHYHPGGKPETDQSSFGLYFTDQPPQRSLYDLMLIDKKIDIPPGEARYQTRDEFTLPIDMDLFGLFPHMHMIGREIRLTAHPADGEPFPLLTIADWDFNWQTDYQFVKPVRIAAGTRLVLEAVHDNSAENPRNPFHPPRRITWGEQTSNEMTAALLQLVPVDEARFAEIPPPQRRRMRAGFTAPR
jgi:mono/diheme cytochrome c family protein